MKNSFRYALMFMFSITLCAFVAPLLKEPTFGVTMKGLENKDVLKDGVAASELSELTLKSSDATIEVKAFTFILARGGAPVRREEVSGNSLELMGLATEVRSGDVIVFEITKISGRSERISKVLKILIR